MNFKKVTIIIAGNLKSEIEKCTNLRTSLGMQAAWKFSHDVMAYNFVQKSFLDQSTFQKTHNVADEKLFSMDEHDGRRLSKAFDLCSRITIEMTMYTSDHITVSVNFFKKAEKESVFRITYHLDIETGSSSMGTLKITPDVITA